MQAEQSSKTEYHPDADRSVEFSVPVPRRPPVSTGWSILIRIVGGLFAFYSVLIYFVIFVPDFVV